MMMTMMRLSGVLLICLFTAQGNVQKNNTHYQGQKDQNPSNSLPGTTQRIIKSFYVSTHTEGEQNSPYNAKEDILYRAYLLFTILGVVGGLYGLSVIYRQTKATERTAEAALKSANTLINAERAWLSVNCIDESGGKYGIEVTNHGRTVAHVTGFNVTSKFPTLTSEKKTEEGEEGVFFEKRDIQILVVPDDKVTIYDFDIAKDIPASILEDVLAQRKCIWYYGGVFYKDLGEISRSIQFSFTYLAQIGHFVKSAPKYATYT